MDFDFRVGVVSDNRPTQDIVSLCKATFFPDIGRKLAHVDPATQISIRISLGVDRKRFYEFPSCPEDNDVVHIFIQVIAMPCVKTGYCAGRLASYVIDALVHDKIPTVIPPKTRFEFLIPLRDCMSTPTIRFLFKLVDEPHLHYKYMGIE